MVDKSRYTANLVSDNNIFSDIVNDRVGIGTTNPASKLHVVGNGLFTGIVTATSFVGNGSGLTNLPSSSGSVGISTNTTNGNQLIPYVTSFGSTTGLGATNNCVFNPICLKNTCQEDFCIDKES